MQAFKEWLNETKEHNTLQTMLQPYIFQKCTFDKHPETRSDDAVLSDLRQFLHKDKCNYAGLQIPSTIYYLELIDENPDSSETMCYIEEDILDKFGDKVQNGWVLLVGDGKTYKHRGVPRGVSGNPLWKWAW